MFIGEYMVSKYTLSLISKYVGQRLLQMQTLLNRPYVLVEEMLRFASTLLGLGLELEL